MKEKDMAERLQQDIMIPDRVWQKANAAFDTVKRESMGKQGRREKYSAITGKAAGGSGKNNVHTRKSPGKRRWKSIWVAVAAAVFLFGTMTVCAAYLHWSKGMEAQFHATEEGKQLLEDEKIAAPMQGEATAGNVTVTAQQSIADSRFANLSFRIDGYDLEEGMEPAFGRVSITLEDESISWTGGFYDGLHWDDSGKYLYDDGSVAQEKADGSTLERFVDENGSMEYDVMLFSDGYIIGKTLHVTFENLGTIGNKTEVNQDLDATWEFDIVLQGSDKVKKFELSNELEGSGATVVYAEISPISLQVTYEFAPAEVGVEAVDENGNAYTAMEYVQPPQITGVRLKDGTMLTYIINGGMSGWEDLEKGIYEVAFATNNIIDTEQVDALLFVKPYPEGEGGPEEEEFYIVPLE